MNGLLILLLAFVPVISLGQEYNYNRGHEPVYYESRGYEYVSDGSSDAWNGGRHHQSKCEEIPANMSLCKDIGYSQMRLPNLLDHDTMSEMVQQSKPWVPLLGLGCHENTQLFLCSLFTPVCVDRAIFPCRYVIVFLISSFYI